uniref:Saposin B-type domain-containing protein n=1 Tax=Rhabditophanes sp. KR3021 TaxID=114890 RepID=A0AC35UHU9_9BILA
MDGILCDICKDAVKKVEDEVTKGGETLKEAISSFCQDIGSILDPNCNSDLDKEIDKIISWIDGKLSPEQICHKFDIC